MPGKIVKCVAVEVEADVIPGVPFNPLPGGVRYVQYRGRFEGDLTLHHDPRRSPDGRPAPVSYHYEMPVWIVAPADPAHGNGTVIINPLHSGAVQGPKKIPEGEQPMALKMLGPRFLFQRGTAVDTAPNYTWIGVRWDRKALRPPVPLPIDENATRSRYDHRYEQRTPVVDGKEGVISAPIDLAEDVGIAMLAQLADFVRGGILYRQGEAQETVFARKPVPGSPPQIGVRRLIAFGHSQSARVLTKLLDEPPPRSTPLFDGWIICSARGAWTSWAKIAQDGTVTVASDDPNANPKRRKPVASDGLVMDIGTEQDINFRQLVRIPAGPTITLENKLTPGNEWVRFHHAIHHRSYEIAGASHLAWGSAAIQEPKATNPRSPALFLPGVEDRLTELAAVSGFPVTEIRIVDLNAPPPSPRPAGQARDIGIVDAFSCAPWPPVGVATPGSPRWTNPLDWNPVVRALLVAMEKWIDGTEPPNCVWLDCDPHESPATALGKGKIAYDSKIGNALGGVRLPDVHMGRGRFYAPDLYDLDSRVEFAGAYVDHHEDLEALCEESNEPDPDHVRAHQTPWSARPKRDGTYVTGFTNQAQKLVAEGFLLEEDRVRLVDSATRSAVGICPPEVGPIAWPERDTIPKWQWPMRFIALVLLRTLSYIFRR